MGSPSYTIGSPSYTIGSPSISFGNDFQMNENTNSLIL